MHEHLFEGNTEAMYAHLNDHPCLLNLPATDKDPLRFNQFFSPSLSRYGQGARIRLHRFE